MRNYPAKLLLFGEHVLLLGASALAVPVPAFAGKWKEERSGNRMGNRRESLLQFAESKALASIPGLDVGAFQKDIYDGWYFDSNVPEGYGLGSSGTLCAGIYDRYAREKTQDLSALKNIFARMESYFHGSSSGIDPLTSYVACPLLIREKSMVSETAPASWQQPPVVFLLDSCTPRQTGPLVQWFLEQSRQAAFDQKLQAKLLPAHEAMLRAWLSADAAGFWIHLQLVSQFQFENFHPMIPANMRSLWEKSLNSADFSLKICGAGGGGFMLGFAKNRNHVKEILAAYSPVFPFEDITQG